MLTVKIEITGPLASGKTCCFNAMMDGAKLMGFIPVVTNTQWGYRIGDDPPTETYELTIQHVTMGVPKP